MKNDMPRRLGKSRLARLSAMLMLASIAGCGSLSVRESNSVTAIVTAGMARAPSTDIEQIYYLGVFDPQEQVPPTIYRVRIRGQASALNQTRYASGWVRAELVDSLTTSIKFDKDGGGWQVTRADQEAGAAFNGRKLVMFGPEGFREAPRDHRLVIAMGSSPEKFFGMVDEALGVVAAATQGQGVARFENSLFRELNGLRLERVALEQIRATAELAEGAIQ